MADQQDQPQQPKIIIDSDWKAQAQKERERLAQKEKDAQAKAPKAPPAGIGGPQPGAVPGPSETPGMPPADFQSLVGTMVTQALMYMGAFPDPETGRAIVSLEHAKFHIDLLGVLEEKTKGNLGAEESGDLTQALSELRMRFVEIVQAIAQMKKEGKLRPQAGGGVSGGGTFGLAGGGAGEWAGIPPA